MYRSTKKFAFEDEDSNDEEIQRNTRQVHSMKNHSIVPSGARRLQKPVIEEEEESEPSSESESEISSESEPSSELESEFSESESEDEDSDHEQNYRKYRKY